MFIECSSVQFTDDYYIILLNRGGPGSFGIVTDYGLDGPGSNPGRDEIFHPPKLALWPTQPLVK